MFTFDKVEPVNSLMINLSITQPCSKVMKWILNIYFLQMCCCSKAQVLVKNPKLRLTPPAPLWPHGSCQTQLNLFNWNQHLKSFLNGCQLARCEVGGGGIGLNRAHTSAALKDGHVHVYRERLKCHSQSFRESGAQSTDWLLDGARLWGLDTELLLWMLLPKLVPSCRRLMWRMTAVALKACCEERV